MAVVPSPPIPRALKIAVRRNPAFEHQIILENIRVKEKFHKNRI